MGLRLPPPDANIPRPKEVSSMPVNVKVPTPLRKFTQGSESVEGTGATVAALMEDLEKRYPGIRERICDDQGRVRRFVNLYVNGDDIRFLQQLETKVKDGDEISIVPAIAGGAR
jgi:molybdopterin synthase sulfur carrier subunit